MASGRVVGPRLAVGTLTLALAVPAAAKDLCIGIWTRDLTRAESTELSPGEALGAIVGAVYPAGPGAAAGILPSDRIVAVNGSRVLADESLGRLLARGKAAGAVRLTVVRGSGQSEMAVQPAECGSFLGLACEAGEQMACTDLAMELDPDVPPSGARAAELLQTACDAGNGRACAELGYRKASGKLGPPDPPGGLALVERACEGGDAEACRILGVWSGQGHFGLEASPRQSAVYYEKGCAAGSRQSCHAFGIALEDGVGAPKDAAASAAAYEEACAREHDQACIDAARMAWCCVEPRDRERAYRRFAVDYMPGCWHVGHAYATGVGMPLDPVRGLALLDKACRGGETDACEWIEQLKLR